MAASTFTDSSLGWQLRTVSTPRARMASAFSGVLVWAMTRAPSCWAIWMPATLTPAEAPSTSTVSPFCSLARSASMFQAVR